MSAPLTIRAALAAGILPRAAGEGNHPKDGGGGCRRLVLRQVRLVSGDKDGRGGSPLHHTSHGPPPPLRGGGYARQGWAFAACAVALLVAGAARAQETESLNPMKGLDQAALTGFIEKPLFDPARALPPPPPPAVVTEMVAPPPPVEPPPALQLVGIVHGRRDMAIVHQNGAEKTVILRNGEKIGSWTVLVRPPVGVTLRSGERTVDFSIFGKGGQAAPPPPAAPVAVGQMIRRAPDE